MIARCLAEYDPRHATLDALIVERTARGPQRPFVTYLPEKRTLSYGEFDALTRRLSAGLDAFGVAPRAHVAVIFENCLEQLVATFGINRGGRVTVPINASARGELLQYVLSFSDCAAVIVEARLYPRVAELRAQLPQLRHVFVADIAIDVPRGAAPPPTKTEQRDGAPRPTPSAVPTLRISRVSEPAAVADAPGKQAEAEADPAEDPPEASGNTVTAEELKMLLDLFEDDRPSLPDGGGPR